MAQRVVGFVAVAGLFVRLFLIVGLPGGRSGRYWCRLLAKRFRGRGYAVTEEAPIGGGKTIDILAVKDGRRIAIEVETGKSDATANARKCLTAGADEVVVVATSSKAYCRLQAAMRSVLGARVVLASGYKEALADA